MANDESGSSGNTKHGPRTVAISASLITSLARGTGDLVDRTWRAPTIHVHPERENNDRRPRQSLPVGRGLGGEGGIRSSSAGQKLPLTKTLSWALEREKRLGRKGFHVGESRPLYSLLRALTSMDTRGNKEQAVFRY